MTIKLTDEQIAILAAVSESKDNLIISALAGAAKTTTLTYIAREISSDVICLSFNKKIATELQERMPPNCVCKTLSSLGYGAMRQTISGRFVVDGGKTRKILDAWIKENETDWDAEEREKFLDSKDDIYEAISIAMTRGWVPDEFVRSQPMNSLMDDEEFFNAALHFQVDELQREAILYIMPERIKAALRGWLDYDDMLYIPTLHRSMTFPFFSTIMIDEAQDLSPLNHAMLTKMRKGRSRMIAVGDAYQSIYAFRGADTQSMSTLKETFSMRPLTLSISFRCPISVVKEARWRAPHMKYPAWAIEGSVTDLSEWNASSISSDGVIICRYNAPLFKLALAFLRQRIPINIEANNFTTRINKTLEKFGNKDMTQDEALIAYEIWVAEARAKYKDADWVNDLADCIKFFIESASTLGGALDNFAQLQVAEGGVSFMTGHKSKGREFNHVYILNRRSIKLHDRDGVPDAQEWNVLYVMQTRAKKTLTYIEEKGYTPA